MHDLTAELLAWHTAAKTYALATVIGGSDTVSRPLGAAMAVDADGIVIGGCAETAVGELCREVLRTGQSVRETCGELEVFVQRVDVANRAAIEAVLRANEAVALIRDLNTGAALALGSWWSVGSSFDHRVVAAARAMLDTAATGLRTIDCGDTETTVFVESYGHDLGIRTPTAEIIALRRGGSGLLDGITSPIHRDSVPVPVR